jgi:hypothetical protein
MEKEQPPPQSPLAEGAVLLPVMTLLLIVTVAPVAKPAAGTTERPPPCGMKDTGETVFEPPVIVTALMLTVGSELAFGSPIVTTGPPPSMMVFPAPAPMSDTLTLIVIPPEKGPGPILMTSPS